MVDIDGRVITELQAPGMKAMVVRDDDGVTALRIGDGDLAVDIEIEPGRPLQSARALRDLAGEALALAELIETREARARARRGLSTL